MQVFVKLFATLRPLLPAGTVEGVCSLCVPSGTRAIQILDQLGVKVDPPDNLVILINGNYVNPSAELQEGDTLSAFPAVAGG